MKSKIAFIIFAVLSFLYVQPSVAQGITLYMDGQEITGSEVVIPADTAQTHTFTVSLPAINFSMRSWSVGGGLRVVSMSESEVVVKCETGVDYSTQYSKYSVGEVTYIAGFEDDKVPEECKDCVWGSLVIKKSAYVYKSFDFGGNAITGPKCISPKDSVTYSVAPWVSLLYPDNYSGEMYTWDIPDSLSSSALYYSADKSSVAFIASDTIKGQEIKVWVGKYNTDKAPLTLTLDDEVAEPAIDGLANGVLCLPLSAKETSFTITNAQSTLTYNWNFHSWGTKKGSTVTVKPQTNEEAVTIKVTGGCSTKEFDFIIARSLTADSKITSDSFDDPYCLKAGSSVTLKVDNAGNNVACEWEVAGDGWTIPSEESTSSTPTASVGVGTGYITAKSAYCQSVSVTDTFRVAPEKPGSISGPDCVALNEESMLTYSVAEVANADSYLWTVSSGWSIVGSSTGNSINVKPSAATRGTITVKSVGCSNSTANSTRVRRSYPAPSGFSPDKCISAAATTLCFSVDDPYPGVLYSWKLPSSMKREGSASNSKICVKFDGEEGDHKISVFPSAAYTCGSQVVSKDSTITVKVRSKTEKTYATNALMLSGFLADSISPVSSTLWIIEGIEYTDTLAPGFSAAVITPDDPVFGDYFYFGSAILQVNYEDGCSDEVPVTWNWDEDSSLANNKSINDVDEASIISIAERSQVQVTPNPASSSITITIFEDFASGFVTIRPLSGVGMYGYNLDGDVTTIDVSNIPGGYYIVTVYYDDNKFNQRQLIK